MKTPKMVEAMNYIDDDLVSGAITYTRKKKSGWLKWGAMAACLCLMIAGAAIWGNLGQPGKIPEAGAGVGGGDHGASFPGGDGMWPEGVDPVVASVAVVPAGVDLLDVVDAISVSISEEDARAVEGLGAYLPTELPEDCRYGKAAHYRTMMKDGTEYQMLRVTYESGEAPIPAPIPENAESANEMTGNTAFLWMVWGHRPDTSRSVYQPEEISAALIEQQNGRVFYIDYDGIYVGVEQLEISAAELFAVIESIG